MTPYPGILPVNHLDASGVRDSSAVLQDAINAALSRPDVAGIGLPAGTFRLDAPLSIGKPGTQSRLNFCGLPNPFGIADGKGETVLQPTFGDRPILSVIQGRGVVVDSIVFDGPFKRGWSPSFAQVLDPATWSVPGVRDSRYSPQCAIAIDPTASGVVPPDGGYPGMSYAQPHDGSSGVAVRNCVIRNCAVGVMIDPTSHNQNSDTIRLDANTFTACRTALAIAGGQSKGVTLRDNNVCGVQTFIDTASYGNQAGAAPTLVSGGVISWAARVANLIVNNQGTLFVGVYGESIGSLGTFGPNLASQPGISGFSGCVLLFNSEPGVTMPKWLLARQPVSFRDCTIITERTLQADNGPVRVDNTVFYQWAADASLPPVEWAKDSQVN